MEKLSPEERAKKIEAWTADAKKHWRVENGELVNDGNGAYLATDKDYGDIELLIEYKTVPKADSGIYLRDTPQVQIWDSNQKFDPKNPDRKPHLGSGGLFNNTPIRPAAIRSCSPTSRSASGTASASSRSASAPRST